MNSTERENLEARLAAPQIEDRLAALRSLCAGTAAKRRFGINLHIHTNESFSVFRSPTEAVWQAVTEGVAVLGINDHYTTDGHEEFREACRIARVPATFSMEAVAMDRQAEADGVLLNDPGNPGRVYLCAKGITRIPDGSSTAARNLSSMRAALERRNREITDKVRVLCRERLTDDGPAWEDVVGLTPRGNTTERHVAKAVVTRLRQWAKSRNITVALAVARLCMAEPPAEDDASLQNFVRAKLLKAGAPCFVEESAEAFISTQEMRAMYLAYGAIPTYPILGNPITGGEQDIAALYDRLINMKFFAAELIPHRNTRERVAEVLTIARKNWWPVFNGTEHNTPAPMPLLDAHAKDPEFTPWFDQSAAVLLGHQHEIAQGRPGFVGPSGTPGLGDARERFEYFRRTGQKVWREASEGSD